MTPHIEAQLEDIADIVLMPGDPLRAKYIAENFLEDFKQINSIRNMFGYTGYYKGKKVTVFASGMGIPSIGIYSYELYKFYNVQKIIRIGTCGSNKEDIKLNDIVVGTSAYSESTFGKIITQKEEKEIEASKDLLACIEKSANNNNIPIRKGTIYTSDIFDVYFNIDYIFEGKDFLITEMEAYGLYFIAKYFNRDAIAMATVVDSKFDDNYLSAEDRQNSLNDMIKIALDSII